MACACACLAIACTTPADEDEDGNNSVAGAAGSAGLSAGTGAAGTGAGTGTAGTSTVIAGMNATAGTAAGTGTAGTATAGTGTAGTATAGTAAGTGVAGEGTAGTQTAGTGTAGTGSVTDKGMGDGQDVVTIGDSYMNLDGTNGTQQSLERISGRDYRNYAVPGTQVLTEDIPGQYTQAASEAAIKTVVMTGGGNDILIGNILCTINWTDACNATVDMVQARLDELRTEMAGDGVEDVVLVSYGYPTNEALRPGLDYSRTLIPEACQITHVPACHYIDPVVELEGKIGLDGIHPTPEGYDILGQLTWDKMQERGVRR